MTDDLSAAFRSVLDRLRELATTDPVLRARLRELAGAVLELAKEPEPVAEPAAARAEPIPSRHPSETTIPSIRQPPAPSIPFRSLSSIAPTFDAVPVTAVPQQPQVGDEDLPIIETRCRLKAEAARWAGTRQKRLRGGADFFTEIEPHDRGLIARAKALPDCFLWMCHRDAPVPSDLSLYDDLAGCFEASADAAAVLHGLVTQPLDEETLDQAIDLAAEAQSALRVAVATLDRYVDNDQLKLFIWLRESAAERRTLIRRYMRREDPADPAGWANLCERIGRIADRQRRGRDRDKRRRSLFNQARYHLKRIQSDPHGDHDHDWRKIIEAVDLLVDEGLPPSNIDLRDFLLPILDDIPDEVEFPKNVQLVLREIDRYLSSRPGEPEPVPEAAAPPAEEMRRARVLLQGRSVVLIGGERRPAAAEALKEALGLRELVWIETREHQTHAVFEPYVARDDVAVVVLAIRWSSHGFGEVKEFCDKYGKALVRLPAGYSPNQVAYHIVRQVGDRLGGRNGTTAGEKRSEPPV
jgi:hypothetical protein